VAPPGVAKGPPGVELDASGSGYESCSTVYLFFDSTRIGSAPPDSTGAVKMDNLSVPGDAPLGRRQVSTSCNASGRPRLQTTAFLVTEAATHRTAFATSVPEPDQVPNSLVALTDSALVTVGLIFVIAFPSHLFNATLEEHYDEVRAWFGLHEMRREPPGRMRQLLTAGLFVALGGVLYSALTPDFGLNRSTVIFAAAMVCTLAVLTTIFRLPVLVWALRRHEESALRVPLGVFAVAGACVLFSRLIGFQPGYIYGLFVGYAFQRDIGKATEGRFTAVSGAVLLAVSLSAWLARLPVATAAAQPGASALAVFAEAFLAGVFVAGLETLVFGLIPLAFLDGDKLVTWSRAAWLVLFGGGLFLFVHVLLRPGSGYVGHTANGSLAVVIALFVAFGLISIAFWAYFRFRTAER
jgi:hypothetical protein